MNSEMIFSNINNRDVKITYAIPTYKRGKHIIETIDSIINQDAPMDNFEILIVNNDPESDMNYLIKKYSEYPISIYRNKENIGMVNNLNRCFQLALGKFVAMIHDDDMLCYNFNREIKSFLEKKYDVIIAKRYNLFSDNSRALRSEIKRFLFNCFANRQQKTEFTEGDSFYAVMNVFLGPTCGTTFNKQSFLEAGLFDTTYPFAFDFYTFQNMISKGYRFAVTDGYVGIYRMEISASNKPEVALDFFTCNYDLLQQTKRNSEDEKLIKYLKKYEKEILHLKYSRNNEKTKQLIRKKYHTSFECSPLKYFVLSIKRSVYYYRKKLNFEMVYRIK